MASTAQIFTADQIDPGQLHRFLSRIYSAEKSGFLRDHGRWWYDGDENRWVLLVGEEIAGYCAVIPTQVLVLGETYRAIWWVDLVIAPEFRGQRLQLLFDEKIRQLNLLKLGVPNELAAKIHRKHGWGVRDDFKVLLLPLHPSRVNSVRRASGWKGWLLKIGAQFLRPAAWLARNYYQGFRPRQARRIPEPNPGDLAAIFSRYAPRDLTTTLRDERHFRWRYLNAPYCDELRFYVAGPQDAPTHCLIAQNTQSHGQPVTRILDVFGDFEDLQGLKSVVTLAVRDAVLAGSIQITTLVSMPRILPVFKKAGFLFSAVSRFCWASQAANPMNALAGQVHWTLADSDNDSPD